MFQLISRNTVKCINKATKEFNKQQSNAAFNSRLTTTNILANFSSKKKRIIQLNPSTINITSSVTQTSPQSQKPTRQSFIQLRHKIQSLPWQQMPFDQLCALDQQTLDTLETQLKKDKFNISDEQFLKNQLKNGKEIPLGTYGQLDRHYKKIYSLLKSTNDYYDEFPAKQELKKGYLREMYITDLKNDAQLNLLIARFIKHIHRPQKLQALAQPTFVKYLLSLKRQLLLQGIHFQTKAQKKQAIEKGQKVLQSSIKQQLPKIKILQVLNYEYEFWQDVKHNRAKNGTQENFLIESREVPNPNETVLLKQLYPTINIKYIARRKSLKEGERCFCLKADLLIQVDQGMKRRVKVEWKGPSSRKVTQGKDKTHNKHSTLKGQQVQEQATPRVNYMVIDYEDIYDGNPTIRPIFYF